MASSLSQGPSSLWTPHLLRLVHFLVGFANTIVDAAYKDWLVVTVALSPSQQAVLGGVVGTLPWSFKIAVALMSDAVPICGRRRVPYMVGGLVVQALSWVPLLRWEHPSIGWLVTRTLMYVLAAVHVGVIADTLVVESMKRSESGTQNVGALQTDCWICLNAGGLRRVRQHLFSRRGALVHTRGWCGPSHPQLPVAS